MTTAQMILDFMKWFFIGLDGYGTFLLFVYWILAGGPKKKQEHPHILKVWDLQGNVNEFLCDSEGDAWEKLFSLKNIRTYKIFVLYEHEEETELVAHG